MFYGEYRLTLVSSHCSGCSTAVGRALGQLVTAPAPELFLATSLSSHVKFVAFWFILHEKYDDEDSGLRRQRMMRTAEADDDGG